jgi:hypothetical protein
MSPGYERMDRRLRAKESLISLQWGMPNSTHGKECRRPLGLEIPTLVLNLAGSGDSPTPRRSNPTVVAWSR